MYLQEENEKLKKTSVSIDDVERLIEENRKMKLEIYKLQVTQYGHSEDNNDNKSDYSLNSFQKSNQFNSTEEISLKLKKHPASTEQPFESANTPIQRNRSPGSSGNLSDKSKYDPT